MTVARHEGLGKRLPKEPSRRVRYERALLIPEIVLVESASRRMFELLFDVMDPVPEHIDFLCFHIQTLSFQYCNHLIEVRASARIRPYPTGRLLLGWQVPGTSCQATIALSLRDNSHSPTGKPH